MEPAREPAVSHRESLGIILALQRAARRLPAFLCLVENEVRIMGNYFFFVGFVCSICLVFMSKMVTMCRFRPKNIDKLLHL